MDLKEYSEILASIQLLLLSSPLTTYGSRCFLLSISNPSYSEDNSPGLRITMSTLAWIRIKRRNLLGKTQALAGSQSSCR